MKPPTATYDETFEHLTQYFLDNEDISQSDDGRYYDCNGREIDTDATVSAYLDQLAALLNERGLHVTRRSGDIVYTLECGIEEELKDAAEHVYGSADYWRYVLDTAAYRLPVIHCARCGHTWTPRSASKPKQCPHCKQTGWDHPARSR